MTVHHVSFAMRAKHAAASAFLAFSAIALAASDAHAQTEGKPRSVIPWIDEAISGAEEGQGGVVGSTPTLQAPGKAAEDPSAIPYRRGDDGLGKRPPRLDMTLPDDSSKFDARALTPPRTTGGVETTVEVAALRKIDDSAAGLIAAKDLGLPIVGWASVSEARAAELAASFKPTRLRSVNSLAVRLLLTAFEPPISDRTGIETSERDFLGERIDALLRFGAAEAAVKLAETAGGHRVAQVADAALIANLDDLLCRALLDPSEAASLPRIYCQILAGDSVGALPAIDASRALGEADEITLGLLEAMAEPELKDLAKPPASIEELTPLRIAAMRRLGFPAPPEFGRSAPLPVLAAAFSLTSSPREQLIALERLERAGAISTDSLAQAFGGAISAESGGVWGRVEAYRRAVGAPAMQQIPSSARDALRRADESGLRDQMARLLGLTLAPFAEESLRAGWAASWSEELRDALRLAGRGDLAGALMRAAGERPSTEERIRDRLAAPEYEEDWREELSETLLARAVRGDLEAGRMLAALDAFGAPIADASMFPDDDALAFSDPSQAAERAFEAVALLTRRETISPEALHGALTRLIAIGLTEEAKMIAIEAVLIAD